jgi:hypothetical protein
VRYSTVPKEGFRELKVNFYREIGTGFELIRNFEAIASDTTRFVSDFRTVSLAPPDDPGDQSALARYQRRVAVYAACLHEAGFPAPPNYIVRFSANEDVRNAVGNVSVKAVNRGEIVATLDQAAKIGGRAFGRSTRQIQKAVSRSTRLIRIENGQMTTSRLSWSC